MSLISYTKMSMMSLDSMGSLCTCNPWLTTMSLCATFVRESGLVALLLLHQNSGAIFRRVYLCIWFQGVRICNGASRSKILWLGLETECSHLKTQEPSRKRTLEMAQGF